MIVMHLSTPHDQQRGETYPLTAEEVDAKKKQGIEDDKKRYEQQQLRIKNALTAEKLMQQAESAGQWIYDPKLKKWYTPAEFHDEFKLYYRDHPLFHQVKLMHPKDGISAGFKQLAELQSRLVEFTQKVMRYYSKL